MQLNFYIIYYFLTLDYAIARKHWLDGGILITTCGRIWKNDKKSRLLTILIVGIYFSLQIIFEHIYIIRYIIRLYFCNFVTFFIYILLYY